MSAAYVKAAKYVWLTSLENLTEKQQTLFDAAYARQLQTGKAWAYKEMLRDLWGQKTAASATTFQSNAVWAASETARISKRRSSSIAADSP